MAETKSKVDFTIDKPYLVNGVVYRPGDEGKVPEEFRVGLKAKIECQNLGRRMPAREVTSGLEHSQNPMDSGNPINAEETEAASPGEAPKRRRRG